MSMVSHGQRRNSLSIDGKTGSIRTSWVSLWLILGVALTGCVTGEPPQDGAAAATPDEIRPEAKDERGALFESQEPASNLAEEVYAELIVPATASKHPHLKPFVGHALIGTRRSQVVVAGVPPRPSEREWQEAVLAFFVWDRGAFRRLETIRALDLKGAKPARTPVALDFTLDEPRKAATIEVVYQQHATLAPKRHTVHYRLKAGDERLTITFAPGVRSRNDEGPWEARLRIGAGSTVVSRAADLGGMRGSLKLLRYFRGEVAAVLASRPFDTKVEDQALRLLPAGLRANAPRPLYDGYEVLLGRPGAARLPLIESAIAPCHYGDAPKDGGLTAFDECLAARPSGTLKVALDPDDAGGNDVSYPFYLFDDTRRATLYLPLFVGWAETIPVPAGEPFGLSDERFPRHPTDAPPFTLNAAEEKRLKIAPRTSGRVSIDPAESLGPAVLSLNQIEAPPGESGVIAPPRGLTSLGPNSYLVSAWPLTLELVEGEYEATLMRGREGVFCKLRWKVKSGDPLRLACPKPQNQPLADDPGEWVDLSTDAPVHERDLYKRAFGVDWLAGSPSTQGEGILSAVRTIDPRSGVEATAYGVGPSFESSWKSLAVKTQRHLVAFFDAARRPGTDVLLELGCPTAGMTLDEYAALVRRLSPDMVRLWGCASGDRQEELLALAGKLTLDSGRLPLLSSTAALAASVLRHGFPRLYVPESGINSPGALLAALRAGGYGLTAGAEIRIKTLRESKPQRRSRKKRFDLEIRLAQSNEVQARDVIVYTENGVVTRQSITAQDRIQTMRFPLELDSRDKWLRVEVRGAASESAGSRLFERGDGEHLGSTNFVRIATLGETH